MLALADVVEHIIYYIFLLLQEQAREGKQAPSIVQV